MAIKPHYEDPYLAYVLRILAWQKFVAKDASPVTDDEIETLIHRVLEEFGGVGRSSSVIHKYVEQTQENLDDSYNPKGWEGDEWYCLYAPFHSFVRNLSLNPVVQGPIRNSYEITMRDPAIPALKVIVGSISPDDDLLKENPRAIYILRTEEDGEQKIYIGITDNDDARISQHLKKKQLQWWFIAQPLDSTTFDTSIQQATETMLISFWNEIASVENRRLSHRTKPSLPDQQLATLLTAAISASYLWFIREQEEVKNRLEITNKAWEIPLKKWHGAEFDQHYVHFSSQPSEEDE